MCNVSVYSQECAANEERQLLEKVAELLASSNSRKKKLVYGPKFPFPLIIRLLPVTSVTTLFDFASQDNSF